MVAIALLIGLLVPVIILLLVAAAVFVVVRLRSGEAMVLSFRTLLTAYFYSSHSSASSPWQSAPLPCLK